MIQLKNVSFQYADCEEGVSNINLTIRDGECVVLTGPSGGGKTTLTRLLNGLAPAYYPGIWAAISSAAVNRKPTTRAALLHGLFSVAAHG